MSGSTALQEFKDRFSVLRRDEGLVDMKFYPGDLSCSDKESFCEEANRLSQAIDAGLLTPLKFGDSTHNS